MSKYVIRRQKVVLQAGSRLVPLAGDLAADEGNELGVPPSFFVRQTFLVEGWDVVLTRPADGESPSLFVVDEVELAEGEAVGAEMAVAPAMMVSEAAQYWMAVAP